jgi:hypothetical protein
MCNLAQEFPMTNRKKTKALKQTRSRKPAAKAQRAAQAVVRSPKPRHLRIVAPSSAEPAKTVHTRQDAPVLEEAKLARAAPEKSMIGSQDDSQHTTSAKAISRAWNVFSPMANVWGYQTMLSKMAQSQMQFAFSSAQRLAQVKSPFEFASVLSELTTKQLVTFQSLLASQSLLSKPAPSR